MMDWNASSLRSIPWWETKQSSETQDLDTKQNANDWENSSPRHHVTTPLIQSQATMMSVSHEFDSEGMIGSTLMPSAWFANRWAWIIKNFQWSWIIKTEIKYKHTNPQQHLWPDPQINNRYATSCLFCDPFQKDTLLWFVKAGGCVGNHSNLKGLFKRSCSGMISFWCKWSFVLQKV